LRASLGFAAWAAPPGSELPQGKDICGPQSRAGQSVRGRERGDKITHSPSLRRIFNGLLGTYCSAAELTFGPE
jgi:hypothetical protein